MVQPRRLTLLLLRPKWRKRRSNDAITATICHFLLIVALSVAWVHLPSTSHHRHPRKHRSKSMVVQQVSATAVTVDPINRLSTSSTFEKSQHELENESSVNVGVLLLNLGGPEKGDDVEGFLFNLFADPDIIRLPAPLAPLQSLIAYIISKRRAPKSRKAYESIGGGSPILKYSQEQAALVKQSLLQRYNLNVSTYIGMRYWYPFTEQALLQIQQDHIQALVIIPLYPQFSISTSGSSLRVLQKEFTKRADLWGDKSLITHTVVPQWYQRKGYIQAIATLIGKELNSFSPQEMKQGQESALQALNKVSTETKIMDSTASDLTSVLLSSKPRIACARHVLFSAHGVPQSYIEAGDPYKRQIEDCVQQISALLPSQEEGVQCHLSYQSRVGPVEWLRPYTDDVIPQLGMEYGVKNLVVVPISFVSEHIETLEEIDIEYRELAYEHGITNWRRCPALNTDATFIDDMADLIVEALVQPAQTVTEACVANNVSENSELMEKLSISEIGINGIGASTDEDDTSDGSDHNHVQTLMNKMNIQSSDGYRMKSVEQTTLQKEKNPLLMFSERINGRVAIAGLILTLVLEWITGRPITHVF